MAPLITTLLALCAARLAHAGPLYDRDTLLRDFDAAVASSPTGTTMVVMDIGANDGQWTAGFAHSAAQKARARGVATRLYMVEPQPELRQRLEALAARTGATFVSAAASKANGTVPWQTQRGSKSASLVNAASAAVKGSTGAVPSIDLAALIEEAHSTDPPPGGATGGGAGPTARQGGGGDGASASPPRGVVSLVKIDVEGYEFSLLPWLLLRGALCLPRYLLIEWHLATLEPQRRLAGLSMRLAFDDMLRDGCTTPPVAVLHDGKPPHRGSRVTQSPNNTALAHTRP